jgi:hypothetical protein
MVELGRTALTFAISSQTILPGGFEMRRFAACAVPCVVMSLLLVAPLAGEPMKAEGMKEGIKEGIKDEGSGRDAPGLQSADSRVEKCQPQSAASSEGVPDRRRPELHLFEIGPAACCLRPDHAT